MFTMTSDLHYALITVRGVHYKNRTTGASNKVPMAESIVHSGRAV